MNNVTKFLATASTAVLLSACQMTGAGPGSSIGALFGTMPGSSLFVIREVNELPPQLPQAMILDTKSILDRPNGNGRYEGWLQGADFRIRVTQRSADGQCAKYVQEVKYNRRLYSGTGVACKGFRGWYPAENRN